ncbi:MAG: hypothetical protein H6728_13030 [Myxococcales bacterium]|nr:hypothetical protein [Myxococcales bacterium]MCB9643992.1 hypothetical protein [Myxococcales bacterium]
MSTSLTKPTKQVRVIHYPNHPTKRTVHTFLDAIRAHESTPTQKAAPPPQLSEQQKSELLAQALQDQFSFATKLLLDGHFHLSIEAFEIIQTQHPETLANCQAQIGAACFFLQRYHDAVQHYLRAQKHGANKELMQANIEEALEAIRKSERNP